MGPGASANLFMGKETDVPVWTDLIILRIEGRLQFFFQAHLSAVRIALLERIITGREGQGLLYVGSGANWVRVSCWHWKCRRGLMEARTEEDFFLSLPCEVMISG